MTRRSWLKRAIGCLAATFVGSAAAPARPRGRVYDWRGPLDRPGRCIEMFHAFDAQTEDYVRGVFYHDSGSLLTGRYLTDAAGRFYPAGDEVAKVWEYRPLRLVPVIPGEESPPC